MTELNFSGSSVAIGAMTSASRALVDAERASPGRSTASTKKTAPSDDQAERERGPGGSRSRRRGTAGSARWARPVEPVEAQRREVRRRRPSASASKWPLTYQA